MVRILVAALLCLCVGSSEALEYQEIWRVEGEGGMSAPNTVRLADGARVIVVCEREVGVVAFDLEGHEIWTYALTPPTTAAPAVGDVDGDELEDVVAADGVGNVVALRNDGSLLWETTVGAGVKADSCPAIVDLDGDGRTEVLIGDTGGTLSCFDGTGTLLWSFSGDGGQMGPILAVDLYETPGKEVIVPSSDRHIYALGNDGHWLWDQYQSDDLFPNSTPVLADVGGDGVPELYIGGGLHHFYQICLDEPTVLTKENVYLHVNSAIGATDIDGDGCDEVVFGNKGGAAFCFGKEGFRWKVERANSNFYAAPLFLNVDSDADLEILMYSSRGDLAVLDADGSTVAEYETTCRPNATPLAGDFNQDGILDLVAGAAGEFSGAGRIVFATLGVPYVESPRNRIAFAVDPGHSCVGPDQDYPRLPRPPLRSEAGRATVRAVGHARLFSWRSEWRYDVANPDSIRLLFLTAITSPDGTVRHQARHIDGVLDRVVLPVQTDADGLYSVAQSLIDADDRAILWEQTSHVEFDGVKSDRQYVTDELAPSVRSAIETWRKTNPGVAHDATARIQAIDGTLTAIDPASNDPQHMAELVRELERLDSLVKAGIELAPQHSFAAWAFDPWAYFHPRDTMPEPHRRTQQIDVKLCQNEYESRAINITNFTSSPLNVLVRMRTEAEGFNPAGVLSLRHAVLVPTVRREEVADALPELDSAGILRVAGYETEQLWLTFNANGLDAGEYTLALVLNTVEPDPVEVILPVRMTVHPISMPRPHPLRFCLWAYDGGDLGTDRPDVLQDLIDHGVTIFFGTAAAAACDSEGNLTAPLDFSAHDESVRRLSPHGMLLFLSPQSRVTGAPYLSEPWKRAFVEYLREWVAHMKTLGLDYEDWALYPYDEPSTPFAETTRNLVEVAKVIRAADPNILIYTDPTSGTTMETVDMFTGLIDIWCPSSELLERMGDELVPVAKQVGKEVWFYDAAGRAKTLSCLSEYRRRFWFAWNFGLTGVGWWTYAHHGPSRWEGPNETGDFFATVYDGPRGPVSSKRWEAARDGVEDYEYLHLLRAAIQEARARGVAETELAGAVNLLEARPKAMEAMLDQSGRRLPLTPDSVPSYEAMTKQLDETRAEIAAMCIELNAK